MPGIKVPTTIFKGDIALEQFFCVSCKLLLKDPVQSTCGHRFCKSCADEIIGQDARPQCPECGEEFEEEDGAQYFPDRFVKRELGNLAVICPFSESGCNWEGKFREYEEHVNSCGFVTLSCKYCNKSVHRDQIESHQQSCPNMPMQCPLAKIGCKSSNMNKDELQKHMQEANSEHLGRLVVQVMSIEERLKLQDSKMMGITHELGRGCDLVEADGAASSAHCDHGVGQSLKCNSVHPSAQNNIVHIGSIRSDASAFDLDMSRFEPVITEGMKSLEEEVRNSLMTELRGKDLELDHIKTTITKLEKTIKAKNAETEDRDFRLSLIENSNHDGSMIWKIPQFSQRKADAQNGKYTSIFSLPFYSGRYGYKMCLRLYIMGDGIGKGTHLSLFFVVMRGEFDNILQWPFTHKVTFKLINQAGGQDVVDTFQPDPMSSSFRKPKSDMNIASGCPRFVSHTELERGGFIVDDTIFIKCVIDTSTIRHP